MFRRVKRGVAEIDSDLGPLAYAANPGDVLAVCLVRPGSLLHSLAEERPLVVAADGRTYGFDYFALLDMTESMSDESVPADVVRRLRRAGVRNWRRVQYSGSARSWHERLRREAAEKASHTSARVRDNLARIEDQEKRRLGII
jgi:hypothetical protein